MRKIIISERMEKRLIQLMINEQLNNEHDKRLTVKDYLEKRFFPIRGQYAEGENGEMQTKELYGEMTPDGNPIKDAVYTHERIFEKIQPKFLALFSDKMARDKFLNDTITAWFYNKINNNGNIV